VLRSRGLNSRVAFHPIAALPDLAFVTASGAKTCRRARPSGRLQWVDPSGSDYVAVGSNTSLSAANPNVLNVRIPGLANLKPQRPLPGRASKTV
jgi:hypothetical protein